MYQFFTFKAFVICFWYFPTMHEYLHITVSTCVVGNLLFSFQRSEHYELLQTHVQIL